MGDALAGSDWQGVVRSVIRVERDRLERSAKTGLWKDSSEIAYYAANFEPTAPSAAQGLRNLMSGNLNWPVSVIVGFPNNVWLVGGLPLLVDLDEDGGDQAFEGGLVGEDPDLDGSALDLLLDGSLDGV